jgi:hypothetical protein
MSILEIERDFKRMGITENNYPTYTNPNAYAEGFRQCSLLKEGSVSYASSVRDILIANSNNK